MQVSLLKIGARMDDISAGLNELDLILNGSKRPDKIKLSVLRHITENFSHKRKIGQGGCGVVYKGILPSGGIIAVKKLFSNKTLDDRMFEREVTAMMMVEHQNTVRFLGYCSHTEQQALEMWGKYILAEERERLLCFDYISKGSLEDYVTDELRGLEWHTRFQIIKGICEGLHHLHKEKGIIHMDLKPPNILLDNDLVPKITDFGISRPGEISATMSKERLFSIGYCAPEYQFNGKMSFKSDVYSLGVIIREMVTGTRNEPNITIVQRRWMHRWKKSAQNRTLYQHQVTECLKLAQRCMRRYPIERPGIQDVIHRLNEMDRTMAIHIVATKSTADQLANMTDDYVAFMLVMPDDKVTRYSFHIAKAMGIMPPWSTRGVVIDVQVQEEVVLPLGTRPMQCKDTALMRWVIVGKDRLSGAAHVSADLFYEQTDVHELELDIVFGAQSESQPPSPSSVHPHPTNDWEDDDQEVQLSSAEKITPFSIQTELLQIYPSELRFTSEEGAEYMSLINKTDDDVIYYIDYDNQEYKIRGTTSRGVVPPHSTCPVRVFAYKKPHGVYTHEFHILMISGSNYRNTTDLFDDSDHLNVYDNKRDEIINQVRAEGGKAHEALLMSVVRVPHPDRDSVATKQNKEIRMDENGLGRVTCMDVHPTQPWVVTCHNGSCCACIWKMVPQTSAYEKIMSTHCNSALIFSVKFIARMQWVACGDFHGYISVRTYLDDKMSEIKRFRAENDMVTALAVHPTHSYLLSCSKDNLIKLWDWEQGWMCARKFSCYGEGTRCEGVLMFNPNEANTFAFVSTNGHVNKSDIKIWSMDSDNPHTILPVKGGATSFAYCITGSDQQYMATADNHGKIEIFDLWSRTHVHTLEASWITYAKCSVTACHPSLPLLASVYRDSIVLWNYTTYGLEKAHVYDSTPYYSTSDDIKGIGFIDIEGSQRLVIAHTKKIEMVDMSYGTLTSQPWDLGPCHLPDSTAPWH
ncbi:uncharacterized protein LOC101779298 isoform X3 [Setaria italica]|uniref:uncharacterized protein LOC101779298 isoform X3 n=1 Tax=Setaria italica TaxID=4555 RepID=UPI000350BC3C|nr:uncharacterized protein LOC101779298 isoform X3 [Setaria italica]